MTISQAAASAAQTLQLKTSTGFLEGTLLHPAGATQVALIIAGSGPTDRDGNSAMLPGKNDSLKLLAEELANAGIASLRYDKRGIGASANSAPESEMRFETLIEDAVSWLQYLQTGERFAHCSVIGHSEGSLIGMVAAQHAVADAYVSLEGAGRTAQTTLITQLSAQLPAPQLAAVQSVIDQLSAGRKVDPLPETITQVPALASMFRSSVQPYLISWFQFDPTAVIAHLLMPILIVQGTTDLQVPVADAYRLADANAEAKLAIIAGMNHVLKSVPADWEPNLAAYTNPDLPLADGLVTAVVSFLNAAES